MTVLPDGLLLGRPGAGTARRRHPRARRAAARTSHRQLTVHPGGDIGAWRDFLLLLGRPPESVRDEGGIARVWDNAGRPARRRARNRLCRGLARATGGEAADWDRIIACCLQGESLDLNDDVIRGAARGGGPTPSISKNCSTAVEKASEGEALGAKSAALLRLLRGIVDAVSKADPDQLEPTLRNMATAIGHLSPDAILEMLRPRATADRRTGIRSRPHLERPRLPARWNRRQPDDGRHDCGLRRAARDVGQRTDRPRGAGVPGAGA